MTLDFSKRQWRGGSVLCPGARLVQNAEAVTPNRSGEAQCQNVAVRFEGSYFTKEQIPAGARQVYRFISAAVGEAKIEILHIPRKTAY